MSDYMGYAGSALRLLKEAGVGVGDPVRVRAGLPHSGIVMPRYEHMDDSHIVLKLESGYNVGLEVGSISGVEKAEVEQPPRRAAEPPRGADGLPRVLLISTGGTIASSIDYRTGAVTPVLDADGLRASVPELASIADVETEVLFSEYSENIVPRHWLQIAEKIRFHEGSGHAGIMVAHGTDTMHYTSAFLSFALAGFPVPIVLVGSQRSPDRASSDAALNLAGAARLITEGGRPGVYIAMHLDWNDEYIACHLGTRARKNHTSKRGAFETVGGDPAFVVGPGGITDNGTGAPHTPYNPRIALDERVALVKYHPGYDPAQIDWMAGAGYRAIIFEGTGLGHVGRTAYDAVGRAIREGVFVGMTSQCLDGRVGMTVYESGRDLLDLGIVPLGGMLPEVALVKAMWAAGNAGDAQGIGELMLQDVASEGL